MQRLIMIFLRSGAKVGAEKNAGRVSRRALGTMISDGGIARFMARSLKLEVGWVCEVLRMTRLAPDIIRAILDGRQPRHLNLHAMRGRQEEVPLDWEEQRVLLGVSAAGW